MITWTLKIFADNFLLVLIFLLLPALGRVIQFEAFGSISKTTYWLIEIPVEGARLLLVLLLVGNGSISNGFSTIVNIFQMTGEQWKIAGSTMLSGLKEYYLDIIIAIIVITFLSILLNYCIALIAENDYTIKRLKEVYFLRNINSVAVTFLLKNLSLIPLILFFEVWLFLKILYKI